jgi:hypothetical protein
MPMKPFPFAAVAVQAVMALSFGDLYAADGNAGPAATIALPAVEVSALRDPVEKSYRRIVRGMDVFEQRHGLAPSASLRFQLLPRTRDTRMEDIALSIVSDTVNIPVRVAADDTFALQRSRRALDEGAVVVPNRRAGSMTWRTDIRSPGLPRNTRRLGDLRLECFVGVEAGLVSNPRSIIDELLRLTEDRDYCRQPVPHYYFFADRPLWSVTLVDGSRREVLSVDQMYAGISRQPKTRDDLRYCDCEVLIDRAYFAPLGDPSWSDDTRVELEYMDDAAPAVSDAPAGSSDGWSR